MLQLEKKWDNEILTIKLIGHLDAITNEIFDNETSDIVAQHVIIDCEQLDHITSTGLLSILNLYKRVRKNCQIEFLNVNERIYKIFDAVGFKQIFKISSKNNTFEES